MSQKQQTTMTFSCDECGSQAEAPAGGSSVPDTWFALGIHGALGRGGGSTPAVSATLCPSISDYVHFCQRKCLALWLGRTFDALIDATIAVEDGSDPVLAGPSRVWYRELESKRGRDVF